MSQAKDPGEIHDQFVAERCCGGAFEKGGLDAPVRHSLSHLDRALHEFGRKLLLFARDAQRAVDTQRPLQTQQLAFVVANLDFVTGFQHSQVLARFGKTAYLSQMRQVQVVLAKNAVERIAALNRDAQRRVVGLRMRQRRVKIGKVAEERHASRRLGKHDLLDLLEGEFLTRYDAFVRLNEDTFVPRSRRCLLNDKAAVTSNRDA